MSGAFKMKPFTGRQTDYSVPGAAVNKSSSYNAEFLAGEIGISNAVSVSVLVLRQSGPYQQGASYELHGGTL